MKYHSINIYTDDTVETYDKITSLLGVQPVEVDLNSKFRSAYSLWTYEVATAEEDPYFDFINNFLDILEAKFADLEKFGVERKHITFWLLYEYDQQCGLEFHSPEMKRLGNAILFCVLTVGKRTKKKVRPHNIGLLQYGLFQKSSSHYLYSTADKGLN